MATILLAVGCGDAARPARPDTTGRGEATTAPERLDTARTRNEAAESLRRVDPESDGWTTEATAAATKKILGHIGHSLEEAAAITAADLAGEVDASFSGSALVPASLEEVYADGTLVVRRGAGTGEPSITGVGALAAALEELRTGLHGAAGATDVHVKIKIVRVEEDAGGATTFVAYQDQALRPTGAIQRSASWRTRWAKSDHGLALSSLLLESFESVETRTDGTKLFRECTDAALAGEVGYEEQLRLGSNYWAGRLEGTASRTLLESHIGIAVADVDGDGLEDVYVCQPAGLPNRLFLHEEDGTLRDGSREAGLDILDSSFCPLFVDLDGDGDQDLALHTGRRLWVFENDRGHFTPRFRHVGHFGYSLTCADFDGDGDLDLYRCGYRRAAEPATFNQPVPPYDARNGGDIAPLSNVGGFRFEDVTAEVGLDENNDRWSYAAAWEDYDNDGDLDLYVASDFGHNNLYRNDGGRFTDVAERVGAVDANFGMSVTWGDVDHDGWMDLYVSNMFSAAGNRIVPQESFRPGVSDQSRAAFLRLARGNTMLANRQGEGLGQRSFVDVSEQADTTMGRWSWGSLFADVNNDGWDDLLVANGYLTQESDQDL